MPEWQTCDAVGMTGLRTDPQLATQLQPAMPELQICNAVDLRIDPQPATPEIQTYNAVDMAGLRTYPQLAMQLQPATRE